MKQSEISKISMNDYWKMISTKLKLELQISVSKKCWKNWNSWTMMNWRKKFLEFRDKYKNYQVDDSIRYTLYYFISFVICGILLFIEIFFIKGLFNWSFLINIHCVFEITEISWEIENHLIQTKADFSILESLSWKLA